MKKYAKCTISLLLVLSLLMAMLPVSAVAQTVTPEADQITVQENASIKTEQPHKVVSEDVSKRGEYYKEFILDSGLRMASLYAEPVHYAEAGQWKEIDNTLKLSGDAYTNTAGIWNVSFPKQLSGNKAVTITKDGYTLSFYMAGEVYRETGSLIRSAVATPDEAQPAQLQSVREVAAQLQQVERPSRSEQSKYPQINEDKLSSRLKYSQVFTGTDIVYDLSGNQVKESLVMSSYNSALLGYRYTLNVGELNPVLTESGEIHLYDKDNKNIVMVMPAPFLVDDAGEYCHDVQLTLTGTGSQYTLTYRLPQQWLSDSSRQWPVVLDPAVKANLACTNINDVTVYSLNDPEDHYSGILDMGYHSTRGSMRSFLKYVSLPALTSADVVVYAQFSLYKPDNSGTTSPVEIHKVSQTWDVANTEWANQPAISDAVEDYAIVQLAGWYDWDITDTVRSWYEGENTGLALKTPEWVENGSVGASFKQFYSSDYWGETNPVLQIVFRNNNGLESYWDYTASSAGRAGTGYVNDYTGNLVWTHSDIGYGGNRMPVSISHIYNANDIANNDFGLGYGWRINYNQRLYKSTLEGLLKEYYVWEDADGTAHYFYQNEDGVYVDEDGLELTLTLTSGNLPGTIKDKEGNTYYFDTQGRLYKLENNQQTRSSINITFRSSTDKRINTITDGTGRKYQFGYYNNFVNRISYLGSGTTELGYIAINYTNSNPIKITYKDGKYSQFTYSTKHLLLTAQDIDGYKLTYTYTTQGEGKPSRVKTVAETHNGKTGGTLTMTYAHNQTTFTDNLGNVQIKQFNNWGNTTSIRDNEGRAQFATYSQNDLTEGTKGNQLLLASKLQNTVGNMFNNSSFEGSNVWGGTNINSTLCTTQAYLGSKSMQLIKKSSATTANVITNGITAEAGATYTFSAYVKTGANASAYLSIGSSSFVNSETLSANQDWTRLQVSYTNTSTSNETIYAKVLTNTAGTVYVDCVQLEKAVTASRFNIIENGDFRFGANDWTKSQYCDGYETPVALSDPPAAELNKTVFRFKGDPDHPNSISQQVPVNGQKGDTFVLAGWARGEGVPMTEFTDHVRKFALRGTFQYTDGSTKAFEFDFNPDVGGETTWQYAAGVMVAEKAFSAINVQIVYDYGANVIYFDGIQLYKEEFGTSYDYDDDGNVKSVKDIQGQITTYEYASNNTDLLKVIQNNKAKVTYTYDSYHNVKTATTAEGIVYKFSYDAYGNNLSVTIDNGQETITSTAVYTTDGNRLNYTTDARGYKTTYGYNADTNVLEWIQYPDDTADTRTEYTYDSMYRLSQAALTTDTDLSLSAKYTYANDLLMSIQTSSTTYNFAYGDFALRSSIKVGKQTLASYTYESGTNRLRKLTYGNGDHVTYTYDTQGKVTKQAYENGAYVTYKYDNSAALATVYDSQSAITTTYYYDFTDRLMKYVEKGGGITHSVGYEFDNINNLTALVETINGTKRTTSYTYDDDNRIETVTGGNAGESYTYDTLGRVGTKTTKHNGQTLLTQTVNYTTTSDGASTALPFQLIYSGDNYDSTIGYLYNNSGNLFYVNTDNKTIRYKYDTADQLIREDSRETNTTTLWTYDNAGNITRREVYPYTASTPDPAKRTEDVVYAYNNTQWGDLLTTYNGAAITYDNVGNPLNDGTWTYTWQHGRQLASMAKSDITWQYSYNADGLRTKRTGGGRTYQYTYLGNQLSKMTVDGHTLTFTRNASGAPISLTYDGTDYYYVTNLQGDIISLLDNTGKQVVRYTYNAWGNLISTTGDAANTVGLYNPLRYRGYVYDVETELYYLQSRYYNPEQGRFINADAMISTGKGLLGNNMFTYCSNNPVMNCDYTGMWTMGFSLGASVFAALGVSISIGVFWDDDGNLECQWSYSVPRVNETASMGALAAGIGVTYQWTACDSVRDLHGLGGTIGLSGGGTYVFGSVEGVVSGDISKSDSTLCGVQVGIGVGVGTEVHVSKTQTNPVINKPGNTVNSGTLSTYLTPDPGFMQYVSNAPPHVSSFFCRCLLCKNGITP